MKKACLVALAATTIAGCVSQDAQPVRPNGHYPTYKELLAVSFESAIEHSVFSTAPGAVTLAYGECAGTFAMNHATPEETSALDAFARGESLMTAGQWKAMIDDIAAHGGAITYATLDKLDAVCPQNVPAFRRYFGPGFNGL